jgi:hypothetical protein
MALALELGLGEDADAAVRRLWGQLEADGVPSLATYLPGLRPHVTLVVSDDASGLRRCADDLRPLVEPVELELTAPGMFPAGAPFLFLVAAPTPPLVHVHEAVCRLLQRAAVDIHPHYRPGTWLPHCTLSMGVPAARMDVALRRCLDAPLPIAARLGEPHVTDSASGTTEPL